MVDPDSPIKPTPSLLFHNWLPRTAPQPLSPFSEVPRSFAMAWRNAPHPSLFRKSNDPLIPMGSFLPLEMPPTVDVVNNHIDCGDHFIDHTKNPCLISINVWVMMAARIFSHIRLISLPFKSPQKIPWNLGARHPVLPWAVGTCRSSSIARNTRFCCCYPSKGLEETLEKPHVS